MTLNFHIHNHVHTENIIDKLNLILMNQQELAQALTDLQTQTDKAKAEVLGKIAELEAAIAAAGSTTAEVDTALANLKASVQGVDDIIPDAT